MGARTDQLTAPAIEWDKLTDEEIVRIAQQGNRDAEEHLIRKYQKMVFIWTRSYFLQGAEPDDLIQEGMIGLYKAIRDFSVGTSSFWSFAKLCIIRNVISAIKGTTRQKHLPLNSYTSLHRPIKDTEGDRTLLETLTNHRVDDPEVLVINREELQATSTTIQSILSKFENEVFRLYISGFTYREIAEQLNTHTKSVDNALCRIKTKIEKKLS
ncbi:MAG: RNA polymerase sporulation sigma factor SigH [Firmicutes bacterium]|mgnify:FL=1|jgi:RNA polymerase sporulation-specific sigma factor|nr:RNA polymerase sporulation sigma factor SigH [Bacillota bacterium]